MRNIAEQLSSIASQLPHKRAVVFPHGRGGDKRLAYTHLTFAQLDQLSGEYARGLHDYGIQRGGKTLLMVKPSLDFFALVFALFKIGAVPVLIDPGMGVNRLLHCIQAAKPTALIGIPLAHLLRILRPRFFREITHNVTVGRKFFWGGVTLKKIHATEILPAAETLPDELAAILFTTGSTGPAKGVEYTHRIFARQCQLIKEIYGVNATDIDLPTFPLFGLFSVALGMTAIIPEMDPTRPAKANPQKIIEAINNHGCTFSFGSPALWGKVAQYCVDKKIKLPTLRRVLMAGAPVPPAVHDHLLNHVLVNGAETHTPYGATESLPICNLQGAEILRETATQTAQGKGHCVGYVVNGVVLKIVEITDAPIKNINDAKNLPTGAIGEIIVCGENVTRAYYNLPDATARAKIIDGENIWHRLGDAGYFDKQGRVWFCGRVAHRVLIDHNGATEILYSVCCEAIFNQHSQVKRCALVGISERGKQTPIIVIEPRAKLTTEQQTKLFAELLSLAQKNPLTTVIKDFVIRKILPTDIRHNAKINRELLAAELA